MAQLVKIPPAMEETGGQSLGWEDTLEKGKATHSSILAWRIPWTIPMGSQRVRLSDFHFHPSKRSSFGEELEQCVLEFRWKERVCLGGIQTAFVELAASEMGLEER